MLKSSLKSRNVRNKQIICVEKVFFSELNFIMIIEIFFLPLFLSKTHILAHIVCKKKDCTCLLRRQTYAMHMFVFPVTHLERVIGTHNVMAAPADCEVITAALTV